MSSPRACSAKSHKLSRLAAVTLGRATATLSLFSLSTLVLSPVTSSAQSGPISHLRAQEPDVPSYQVAPAWPKQLPNDWIMGQVGGLTVDSQDHVWVLQRPRSATADEVGAEQNPKYSKCCHNTPSVLEFDKEGNLLQAWGGPGYVPDWPLSEHGIWVDKAGNVWLGGNGAGDRQILKFTNGGRLLMEIGHASTVPQNNQDTTILGQPAGIEVDDAANEVYIADGYLNKRVVVYDSNTGAFKRGWGAYGIPLSQVSNAAVVPYVPNSPADPQFKNPVHAAHLSVDGLLYVCDRVNDRIQVFHKDGTFVQEFVIRPATTFNGSTWTLSFSHDAAQKFLLIADGTNNVVWIVRRSDGAIVSQFGHSGRNAGQFHWVHQAATDSEGSLYTGEVDTAKRVQKFTLVGGAGSR